MLYKNVLSLKECSGEGGGCARGQLCARRASGRAETMAEKADLGPELANFEFEFNKTARDRLFLVAGLL